MLPCPPTCERYLALHDHPRPSGSSQQRIGRWVCVEQAAIEQAPEDVLAPVAAIESVAVLVEVGLQVGGVDAVEDVERPALEVGEFEEPSLSPTK